MLCLTYTDTHTQTHLCILAYQHHTLISEVNLYRNKKTNTQFIADGNRREVYGPY